MKYSLKDAVKFERGSTRGWIYNSADDFEYANVVRLDLKGNHGKIRNEKSDRIYYVLEGNGEFIIKEKSYLVRKSDVVIVPRNTPYDFKPSGEKISCILISCPAFDRNSEFELNKFEYHGDILVFNLSKATEVSWDGWKGLAYNSKEEFSRASALYIEVTKRHGLSKTTKSDRIYYVLDGIGKFMIEGKEYKAEKTDVVIIPKDIPYDYKDINKSILKLFMVHSPAFDPEYVVDLE